MVTSWAVILSPEVKKRLEKIPNPDRRKSSPPSTLFPTTFPAT
jgi:hypothetical protein